MADDKVSQTQQSLRQGTGVSRGMADKCPMARLPSKISRLTQGEARAGLASLGHGYSLGFRVV